MLMDLEHVTKLAKERMTNVACGQARTRASSSTRLPRSATTPDAQAGGSPCAAMAQGGLHCHHQSPSDASGSWPCMYTYKHTYTHPYIKMYLDIQISGCMQREIGALQAGPGGHVHMQTYIYPHAYTPMYIDVLYTSFFHTI